jgi:hypothetical protein
MYPEFPPGCPSSYEFYDLILLSGEGEIIPSPSMRSMKGVIPCP